MKILKVQSIKHPFMSPISMPIYYIELRNKEERKKSRCFIEYFYDLEIGEHNSYGFYAKSWEVGKATAHRWIKEFNEEIVKFDTKSEVLESI